MLPERARLLSELLREMREQDGGCFPEEAWLEVHRNFAVPYVEVVLMRPGPGGVPQVYLTRRPADDPYFPGRPWHIPGGIWRVAMTMAGACGDIARRELGVEIVACREVMTYKSPDHPYANPISHVCLCEAATPPRETEEGRFVFMDDLPVPLILHQDEFLRACSAAYTGAQARVQP